jgi:hypothetical protein
MKATEFSTVVAKPTMRADRFVECWIKLRIAVKAFHFSKKLVQLQTIVVIIFLLGLR